MKPGCGPITDSSPLGIFVTALNGECVYINPAWHALTGLNRNEATGLGWTQALHPQDRDRVLAEWNSARENASFRFQQIFRFQRPDKTVSWVCSNVSSIHDGEKVIGYTGTVEDITSKHEAEEKLRLQYRRNAALAKLELAINEKHELEAVLKQIVEVVTEMLPAKLHQVLTNLLSNAIKFTPQGEVSLRVSRVEEDDSVAVIRFEVIDTGIGIPEDVQKNLFQAFQQADGSTARKYGGTGLGLAISKQLVEHMGGEIGLQSKPNEGSTFFFTVRMRKQPASAKNEKRSFVFTGQRVLIVDDNATNREILHQYLSTWDIAHETADLAEDALAKMKAACQDQKPFTIVILDLQMPGMDGMNLAEKIKENVALQSARLILLSSLGDQMDAASLQKNKIDCCLLKPVKKARLFDVLANLAGTPDSPGQRRPTPAVSETALFSRLKILLAEDNMVNQKVALGQLRKLGYKADVAANGLEVVRALEKIPYQLIFMDCQMPEMDGYEATRRVRERDQKEGTKTIIVAMTANAMQGDREKCRRWNG